MLRLLSDTYEDGVYPQSLYKTFFDPLFYDVFNEKPEHRNEQVSSLDVYSDIPYLNGGLFRPELNGGSGLSERTFDVRDTVLKSIIDLLEKYLFSTEGGPTDIDPSVLGNVFEKTINYLTTDPGDQNADLGAYYTPKEITRFSAWWTQKGRGRLGPPPTLQAPQARDAQRRSRDVERPRAFECPLPPNQV